jgi:beta-lactamase class D
LYGKTGSGVLAASPRQLAWFVGWVESGTARRIRTFACVVRGGGVMGSDVRAMVERILKAGGLL